MKEFLDNLYKQCASPNGDGVYEIMQCVGLLCNERKFESLNQMLMAADLTRLDTANMYALVHTTSSYIHQLPYYKSFYQKVRGEFARRGESSNHISELFDKFENGWEDRLFDPNELPNKSHEQLWEEKLMAKIAWAKEIGDKDLENMLTYYQAERLRREEKNRKFHELERIMGEEEMRKRTIKSLREMADLLEKSTSCWPGIYYCDLPEDPLSNNTFIDGIEVVISYPWPG